MTPVDNGYLEKIRGIEAQQTNNLLIGQSQFPGQCQDNRNHFLVRRQPAKSPARLFSERVRRVVGADENKRIIHLEKTHKKFPMLLWPQIIVAFVENRIESRIPIS